MTATSDPITIALTGALPFALFAGVSIACPLAIGLLRLYRRAVVRAMNQQSGADWVTRPAATAGLPPESALQFEQHSPAAQWSDVPSARTRRAAVIQAVSVAAFAAILTCAWLVSTRDGRIGPVKLAMIFWTYFWPAVLVVNMVASVDRKTRLQVALGYFALLLAITVVALSRSQDLTVGQVLLFWVLINGPPTALLGGFLIRRVRAVGPLVLAFTVLAVIGALLLSALVGSSSAAMRTVVTIGIAVGLGGTAIYWAQLVAGFALFAVGGWYLLKRLGAGYAAQRFSDETLTLDTAVLCFGMTQAVSLVFEHWGWITSAFVAFAGYKAVSVAGRRWQVPVQTPRRLLLLRVFALGRRSESLFDALRRRWLRAGPIALIAGPDLATSAIEPHEFLSFLSGDLSRTFVSGDDDLARRVDTMARRPDPDGRYRVTEFFCRSDSWQPTMRRLVAESDAVLMDLRGFGKSNQGCIYELGRLLDEIELGRVLFVVDGTTNRADFETTLAGLWKNIAAASPNRRVAAPTVRSLAVTEPTAVEVRALLGMLGMT